MLTSSSGHQQQPLQSQATATNSIDHQINVPMTNLEEGGTVAAAAATGGVGGGAGGAAAIGAEYASSLADLTVNSKPLINMLTMLAEENERFAGTIVKAIETHLAEVAPDAKLPVLYLIDSIVKNVKGAYLPMFTQCIVNLFCGVFEKVNERVRANMYKLRQTWGEVFPQIKLYALDCRVNCIDPAWPITARPPTGGGGGGAAAAVGGAGAAAAAGGPAGTIHVNPNFLRPGSNPASAIVADDPAAALMKQQLMSKQHELLILERKKLELQLLATKKVLEEQERELKRKSGEVTGVSLDKGKDVAPALVSVSDASLKPAVQQDAVTVPKSFVPPPAVSSASGVRIAPVSSELLQASRRIRDPRLARQLESQQQQQQQQPMTTTQQRTNNTLSSTTTKPIVNPNNVFDLSVNIFNKSNTNIKNDLSVDYSNNSNNKRFGGNTNPTKTGKKTIPHPVSVSNVNSKFINSNKVSKQATKSNKSSSGDSLRSKKTSSSDKKSQKSSVNKSGKKFRDSSSCSVSAIKDKSSPRKSSSDNGNSGGELSPPKKTSRDSVKIKSPKFPPKQNRRVRSNSDDEEDVEKNGAGGAASNKTLTRDVDLRVLAPPPEKQARLQAPTNTVPKVTPVATKDVDLRPTVPTTLLPGTKKRTSPEKQQGQPAKRLKSETFDVLFGNEDVDLRKQSPAAVGSLSPTDSQTSPQTISSGTGTGTTSSPGSAQMRVESPPPPPIISKVSDDEDAEEDSDGVATPRKPGEKSTTDTLAASGGANVKGDSWAKVKVSPAITPASPDKVLLSGTQLSNFEAVRAKLAEATKTRDKLGRPLLFGKNKERRLFGDSDDERSKFRPGRPEFETDSQDGMEDNLKIIMSQAQEQINNGSINPTQYNTLLKQLVQINENKKLQEAQRRESMGKSLSKKGHNESLTPISDDEFDMEDDSSNRSPKDDVLSPPRNEPSLSDTLLSIQANNRLNKRQNQNPPMSLGQPLLRRDRFGNLKPDNRFGNRMPAPPMGGMERPWQSPWENNWPRDTAPIRHPVAPVLPTPNRRAANWPSIPRNTVARYEMPFVRSKVPLKLGSLNISLPPPPFPLVQSINRDTMKSINIDRVPRMIRFYEDDVAVALMNWDDPREIGFQDGSRRICIDNRDTYVLHFNRPYMPVSINGVMHQIKFGSPTRELYVDGKFYEGYFGGAPLLVPIDNKMVTIKLEGPPPQVRLGVQRNDLVAGQITLLIDAKYSHPIFLDAKPQKVEIDNEVVTIRFADAFKTVLINELPFSVEFGGLPKSILVKDRKHFIRFTVLPRGMKPGQMNIRNMGTYKQPYIDLNDIEMPPMIENNVPLLQPVNQMPPMMPPMNNAGMPMFNVPPPITTLTGDIPRVPDIPPSTTIPSSIPSTVPPLLPPPLLSIPPPITTMASTNASNIPETNNVVDPASGYQMETSSNASNSNSPAIVIHDDTSQNSNPENSTSTIVPGATGGVVLPPTINVNDLFEKLVASGILQGVSVAANSTAPSVEVKDKKDEKVEEKPEEVAKPVSFAKPETLKVRQAVFISNLYKGMQCSSCGTRFPPEQTMKYSQHLDWHFRQNRRDRDSTRRPFSRKWYYDVTDWVQYEEIEDLEEREKNWFDTQQSQQQSQSSNEQGGSSNDGVADGVKAVAPNVAAGPEDRDAHCIMCLDRFDQFYDEEKEEWCLRNAVRVDGMAYHPVCYEDHKASLEAAELEKEKAKQEESAEENKDVKKIEDSTIDLDDDKIIILEDEEEDDGQKVENKEEQPEPLPETQESSANDETDDRVPEDSEVVPMETEENIPPETTISDDKTDDKNDGEPKQPEVEDDDDDDDVHIHEEPVELVVLNDDEDEQQFEEIGMLVKIKEEPISDNEEDLDVDIIEDYTPRAADNTQQSVISSIDGNVELEPTTAITTNIGLNRIRINISTASQASTNGPEPNNQTDGVNNNVNDSDKDTSDVNRDNVRLKEALRGVELQTQEPVCKGNELSGLCCIM